MKMLVTAFEPFNGRDINPSQLILEQIETERCHCGTFLLCYK